MSVLHGKVMHGLTLVLALLMLAAFPALAAPKNAPAKSVVTGPRVGTIDIQGIQRVEPETVKSYMLISDGDPYDADRVDQSLKALYNTGLFADVSIRYEAPNLIVRVVENPIVNRVAFEGNKRIKRDQLQTEVKLAPRSVYTRTKVQNDVRRILDLYRRNGRFAATVDPKIIQLEQNRVDLVFEIDEGQASYVKRINFVGNKTFSDSKLREALATKEDRWYRFLSSSDTYDPDRLTYDRELLRRYYMKNGFADFRVVSAIAELAPDREGFFITVTIDEGDRYKFGNAKVEATLKDMDSAVLDPLVVVDQDDWFNADKVEDSVQKLTDVAGSKGYAFVEVSPQLTRNHDEKTIDVVYNVAEGPRVFVDRIDIVGNVRTMDKVVRREFALVEGDAFNTARMRRAQQRLQNLDFFEKVTVTNVPSETAPDRTVVKVEVQEKATGELSFGVGWSTVYGPLIETSVRERNLLGRGQDLRLSASLALRQTQVDLGFTEPYLFDKPISGGIDLFTFQRRLQTQATYNWQSIGGALRMAYRIDENLTQSWRYTLRQDRVTDIKDYASIYIKQQRGTATHSGLMHSLTWDYRDNIIEPHSGYFIRMDNEYVGLGGTEYFLRNGGSGGYFIPFGDEVTLDLMGGGGFITELNDRQTRITERYYLGGLKMRGFAYGGISPRDRNTGDAIGGLWEYYGTAQLRFPLGFPEEFGVSGQVFLDAGSVGKTVSYDKAYLAQNPIDQSTSLRMSIGGGFTWKSPMGPVTIDLGYPIMKESFDRKELLRFNFGSRF